MRIKMILRALLVLGGTLLSSGESHAANSFTFEWHIYNYPNSCQGPGLRQEGAAFFWVNTLPIPTYSIPASLRMGLDGDFDLDCRAPFSGTLFGIGSNAIEFGAHVRGFPACVQTDNTVRLRGGGINRLLFQIASENSVAQGATDINLSLREVDPNLADQIELLQSNIRAIIAAGLAAGQEADAMRGQLEALEAELNDFLDRGFDEITPEELDELLARFDGLPAAVRDSLVGFLRDMQANIVELRAEIARIGEVYAQRVDNIDGVGDGAPGFDPQDGSGFEPIVTGDPPPIDIPEVIGDGPWDDTHDPYARYADETLAALSQTIDDGGVVQRGKFLTIHGAWIHNIQALELILQRRIAVTVREWGAFLGAKGRVLEFLEQHIDRDGWMRDAPVSPELKALIAFLLDLDTTYRFKLRAEALKLELNTWVGELTERQRVILNCLLLFDAIIRERVTQQAPQESEDGFWSAVGTAVDTVISFTPVGDFLDFCSALSGRSHCLTGEPLTLEERALFALGVAVGSGAAWKAAAAKMSGAVAGVVRKSGDVLEEVRVIRPKDGIISETPLPGGSIEYLHASGVKVRYNRNGFPIFDPFEYKGPAGKGHVTIELTGVRATDFRRADEKAGFPNARPEGYTWHHDRKVGRMVLIPTDIHNTFRHAGGVAIWEKMHGKKYQ